MTTQTRSTRAASGPAEHLIGDAGHRAHDALDGAADLARQASAAGAEAVGQVDSAVRSGLRSARTIAHEATVETAGYVRERPLQALLVAAAAVAAAIAIAGLLGRSRNPG